MIETKVKPHWEQVLAEYNLNIQLSPEVDNWPTQSAVQIAQRFLIAEWQKKHTIPPQALPAIEATAWLRGLYSIFQHQGSQVFRIARSFGEALLEAPVNVNGRFLPFDNKLRCIEFPEPIRFDMNDGMFCRCVYVVASDYARFPEEYRPVAGINRPFSKDLDPHQFPRSEAGDVLPVLRSLTFHIPLYDASGLTPTFDTCGLNFFREDETIEEAIDRARSHSDSPAGMAESCITFAMKCLLYINSGEPDLRSFRPTRAPSNPSKLKRWAAQNLAGIPMTLVGFDFKKPKIFSKDSTLVRMHLRWQPYGPQRSKVKLIWIDEHTRQLNKEIFNEGKSDPGP